jgi:mRNA-degrading endonuclease toxin of MazEF toxin-antitoxin module
MKRFSPSRARRAGRRTSMKRIANQLRAIPQSALQKKIRDLTEEETAELELATDEALGRVEPPPK